ncbi:hypothetical protein ABEB22_12500 [Thioclava sp. 'Guangxiensis']|uniref:hypothetical protein n=1 Tax=Thioclava sp. 'Guangxiensis' TaxID=3149044 RepID=UPI003878243D
MLNTRSITNGFSVITGPSHSHRLRHAIRTEQVPNFNCSVAGLGGMPIWNERLGRYRDGFGRGIHLVGDFRFGNKVLETTISRDEISSGKMDSLGIDKALISEQNDKLLYEAAIQTVKRLIASHPEDQFIFWDLSIREMLARQQGRYCESGQYQHPTWNLATVLAEFDGSAIDTSDILTHGQGFHVDGSAHPSFLGFMYLLSKTQNANVSARQLNAIVKREMLRVYLSASDHGQQKEVHFFGTSRFIKHAISLVKSGAISLPTEISLSVEMPTQISDQVRYVFCPPYFNGPTADVIAKKITRSADYLWLTKNTKHYSLCMFDQWATNQIKMRRRSNEDEKSKIIQISELESLIGDNSHEAALSEIRRSGAMVELGETVTPSTYGIIATILRFGYDANEDFAWSLYSRMRDNVYSAVMGIPVHTYDRK